MQTLLSNWNFFRILRVALGVFILVQGVVTRDTFSIIIGSVFAGLAIFNIGCCGAGECNTTTNKKPTKSSIENIEYEEVVNKK